MGTLSQKGIREPAKWVVIFWGVVTGAAAAPEWQAARRGAPR
nr:hypothetical protein OG781_43565 [Streptomyces sp. NBC_00830]